MAKLVYTVTLTTMALYHSSLRWFEACSCKPTPRGLPSSFMQHGCTGCKAPVGAFVEYLFLYIVID